jgi:hypothetical protein
MKISDRLLWDVPPHRREKLARVLDEQPGKALKENNALFVKALNSISWYELLSLFDPEELNKMLTDETLEKIFPPQRRNYYQNARRLLSKYTLSSAR